MGFRALPNTGATGEIPILQDSFLTTKSANHLVMCVEWIATHHNAVSGVRHTIPEARSTYQQCAAPLERAQTQRADSGGRTANEMAWTSEQVIG